MGIFMTEPLGTQENPKSELLHQIQHDAGGMAQR